MIRATKEDAEKLQEVLHIYEVCSGQMINKDKSAILFSPNTTDQCKQEVKGKLQLTQETFNDKYLGLPIHVGRSRSRTFEYLKDKVWQRIQGWKERLLSNAGKEVLIKAVAQAVPTYAMGCFDLTKKLCDQISALICKFWWSQHDKERKLHWVSWDKMKKPKKEGGMGFRDIHSFNLAMLAKQGWRLLHNPSSLCARVLKAKYFPDCDVLQATSKRGMSYTWRSILRGIDLLKEGIIWRVGNGENIRIWQDPWLPRGSTRRPMTTRGQSLLTKVQDLIDPVYGEWDEDLVLDMFYEQDARIVLSLPVHTEMDDIVAWHYDQKGMFSVKSAYWVQCEREQRERVYKGWPLLVMEL